MAAAKTPTDNVNVKGERWKDIMVLPRRPLLKSKRVELMPMYHFNLNNPLIRNHGLGLQINYFLSEAMWLGLEGTYYLPQQANDPTGTDFLVGAQSKVLPAVNKLVFSTLLDFGYVPVYGKFALFNRAIIHWEAYVTLGIGVYMSQVIPIKLSDPAFTNISAMFVFPGVGTRLFLTKWLALNAFLKLYGYPDTFEPVAKNITPSNAPANCMLPAQSDSNFASAYSSCRKNNGDTSLVLDVVFGLGLTFFLPPKFEFKLPR